LGALQFKLGRFTGKSGYWGVLRGDNDREVRGVDPPFRPVDSQLIGGEAWIPQDNSMMAQVCEEEPHDFCDWTRLQDQIRVEKQVSLAVSSPIDIEQRAGCL